MAIIPVNPIYLDADDDKGRAAWFGNTGYFFATGRLRSPTLLGTSAAATQFTAHKVVGTTPPYWTNNYRFAFPGHYTRADGITPSEIICPNNYNVAGFSMMIWINGAWVIKTAWDTSAPKTVVAGAGYMMDGSTEIVFDTPVPPSTPYQIVTRINMLASGDKLPMSCKNRAGTFENAAQTVVGSNFHLTVTGGQSGSDGRLGGMVYAPSFGICKQIGGLTRPVFWVNGDSIGFGKNENENNLPELSTGAVGYLSRALEDETRSDRMSFYNSCIPGVGQEEQKTRTPWQYKLGLIEMCPNRPYTHIITEHMNNASGGDYTAAFKPRMITYYAFLKTCSTFWGDTAAPIYQTLSIPRPDGSDYGTSRVNQGSSGENYGISNRWLFDADLLKGDVYTDLAGVIPTNDRYSYDHERADGKWDRTQVPGYEAVLTTALTSGDQFVNVNKKPRDPNLQFIVLEPGTANAGRHVTSIVSNGDGTWRLNLDATLAYNKPIGTRVAGSYWGDSVGLHPNTSGHKLIAQDVIDWKNNQFPWLP